MVSLASPTCGVWAEMVSSPVANFSRRGAFFLSHEADAADRLHQLFLVDADLVLEFVRQQLLIVGELSFDQPRCQHNVCLQREDDLSVHDADADLFRAGLRADTGQLFEGGPRHDDFLLVFEAALGGRLANAQPVAVGRHHLELVFGELDQDAGEDRPGLVSGGCSCHGVDGRHQRRRSRSQKNRLPASRAAWGNRPPADS